MSLQFNGERFIPGMRGVIETEHMHRYLLARSIAAGLDVLDVASGEGYGAHMLSKVARSVLGVDISEEAILHAQQKYQASNLRYLQGDCAELPVETASVDMVVSFETIEHHDRHEAMMREFRRALRPGGVLLISSPNRPEYDKTLSNPNPFHVKELDFAEFTDLLNAHFAHVVFYGQRVLSGSAVVPCHQYAETGFMNFSGSGATERCDELDRPTYFVAVASDSELLALGTSFYESQGESLSNGLTEFLEARVYLSERVNGSDQLYGEARGATQVYRLDGARKTIQLAFPSNLQPLARLRLDIANAPVAITLHTLAVHQADGAEIWRWGGGCDLFVNQADMVCLPDDEGALILSLSNDPRCELSLAQEVLSRIHGGCFLRLELTATPLQDVLPGVLSRLQAKSEVALPASMRPQLPASAAGHLAELGELLKTVVERKNATIAAQKSEIQVMRDRQNLLYEQLIRAEAQLDLLKQLVLPEAASRLERL